MALNEDLTAFLKAAGARLVGFADLQGTNADDLLNRWPFRMAYKDALDTLNVVQPKYGA
jgi:hypothetical protein